VQLACVALRSALCRRSPWTADWPRGRPATQWYVLQLLSFQMRCLLQDLGIYQCKGVCVTGRGRVYSGKRESGRGRREGLCVSACGGGGGILFHTSSSPITKASNIWPCESYHGGRPVRGHVSFDLLSTAHVDTRYTGAQGDNVQEGDALEWSHDTIKCHQVISLLCVFATDLRCRWSSVCGEFLCLL